MATEGNADFDLDLSGIPQINLDASHFWKYEEDMTERSS